MKTPLLLLGAGLIGVSFLAALPSPAEAGKRQHCQYIAYDTSGNSVQGHATRKKGSVACKIARQRCNRRLERKQRQHKFGRTYGCKKVVEYRG